MSNTVDDEWYKYSALTLATTFLIPQAISGYRSGSLKELSAASMWWVLVGSGLWAYYLYFHNVIEYLFPTVFVCFNAFFLLLMKLYYYNQRVTDHFKTFEKPASGSIPVTISEPTTTV